MTLDELLARESIRHTIVSYNMAGDRLRVDEFVAVFTDDAIYEINDPTQDEPVRNVGRDAIRAFITGFGRGAKEAEPVHHAKFIRHHLSTCQIDITGPDTAKSRTYWTAYTDIGPDHGGIYIDAFRKTGDRWLISQRQVRLDWSSPNSLMAGTAKVKQRAAARK